MNRFDGLLNSAWSILIAGALAFAVVGCEGDTGPQGPAGPQGPEGPTGPGIEPIDQAKAEACATCHNGIGTEHQALYDEYTDPSRITLAFDSVASVDNLDGTFTVTATFTVTFDGVPYVDTTNLAGLEQKRFFALQHFAGTQEYLNSCSLSTFVAADAANGQYAVQDVDCGYAPEASNAHVYGYVADGALFVHEGGTGAEIPEGSHVHLYADVANAAVAFGTAQAADASAYLSPANVGGCQKCHGTPYLKHGYRAAVIEDAGVKVIPDFTACKSCHFDDRGGGHEDWQWMVDDPLAWATTAITPELEAKYAYTANIMNDVHMSHAMEFPYPQSMQNCATCHGELLDGDGNPIAGTDKLATVLADTNFTAETCLSCHPLDATNAKPGEKYNQPNRAPALTYLWTRGPDLSFHSITANCQGCHGPAAPNPIGSSFNVYHTGYDVNITNAAGDRYADLYTVSIDAVTYDDVTGLITVDFSASDPAIVPELYISFYGWDSKHFIAPSHERDANEACQGFRPGCQMEYVPESSGGSANPLFTEDAASVPGAWRVTADPSLWQLTATGDIPTMIADGVIKRFEVTVAPELNLGNLATPGPNLDVVLTAANETFDLDAGAVVDDYFKGVNATVSTAKCNVCHDALASSFHSESGRGGLGIEVCKNCHNPTYAGSHLEMASRSIDSYIHAIHSFQDFDVGDIFTGEDANENPIPRFDPVDSKRYDMHIKHVFPNFTIRNCEACHVTAGASDGAGGSYPVVYNVPDQRHSMPGLLSGSDLVLTWYDITGGIATEDPAGRNLGSFPSYVTGSASRACGGCHRARLIRDDEGDALRSFFSHTEQGGTLIDSDEVDLYDVIFTLMESVQ